MARRVVITGIGLVTPVGSDADSFWKSIQSGTAGFSRVRRFDTTKYGKHYGAEIRAFDAGSFLGLSEAKIYGRASQFAIVATARALEDSGIANSPYWSGLRSRTGVMIGTTFGESQILERTTEELLRDQTSTTRRMTIGNTSQYSPNSLSASVGRHFDLGGFNCVVPTACSAGNHAIGIGSSLIVNDMLDAVVAGGSDPLSEIAFSGFARLGVMADEKCQPFDKNRKGMIVGEGSGVLILEEYSLACARGAHIYGEIIGLGLSCDARHMTTPSFEGVLESMQQAMRVANLEPSDVDYICAHGTGTQVNDRTESTAIRKLFYEQGNQVPVSSIKSVIGHAMGAASAIEAIACVLALGKGEIPPTAHHEIADPECDIDCVPNKSRHANLNVVLNNAFAFGGNNACLAIAAVRK